MAERLSYEDSCRRLSELGWAACEPAPPIPDQKPRYDDEDPLGVILFRTYVEGDLSALTLPRTYFGRSDIKGASFRATDLRESTLCWNDFLEVDFSRAVLVGSDLRASLFVRVSFAEADLGSADLRRSSFLNCLFDRASMKGTVLSRRQTVTLSLSASQLREINWVYEEGDEPGG